MVRRVGSRLPLRRARARRSRVREVPADPAAAGSGSSTRTGRWRPTSGRSTTSTRRCRRGRRSRCSRSTARRDIDFLSRVFDKLLVNFTWWINREDADGTNLFEGGFLGLDNIGPIDRSHLPPGYRLEQSDSTGWMGFYALSMAAIASILRRAGRPTEDLVVKFLEQFALISEALRDAGPVGRGGRLLLRPSAAPGRVQPVGEGAVDGRASCRCSRSRSSTSAAVERAGRSTNARRRLARRASSRGRRAAGEGVLADDVGERRLLLGVVGLERVLRLFEQALRRDRVSLAVRAAGRVALPPRASVHDRGRRARLDDRLRARRVDHRHVRRQLELARADLDARQLPGRQRPRAATRASSATT